MRQLGGLQPLDNRGFFLLLGVIIASAVLMRVPRLTVAPDWNTGDYAQYVMHAANLVEGRPFEETGYIYNPDYASLAPRAYPPGYPVLLAPVYAVFDGEMVPMRLLTLALFAACLLVAGLLFRRHLSPSLALAGVALVGLNPQVQSLALEVTSDVPFLLFLLLGLTSLETRSPDDSVGRSLLVGVILFIPFSIRTIGGLLPVSLVLASLWRSRRVGRGTLISLGCFASLVVALSFWTTGSASYLDQLTPSLATFFSNAVAYSQDFSAFWDPGWDDTVAGEWVRKVFTLLTMVVITVGLLSELRRGATTKDFFVVLYVVVVLTWPAYQGARFLVPVFPLACLYLLLGARALSDMARSAVAGRATLAFATVVPFAFYVGSFVAPADATARLPVDDAPSRALHDFLRETPEDAVVVFAKPRVLSLMTGRRAVANHQPDADEELLAFFRDVGATYVVLGPEELGRREYLEGFVERNASLFDRVFVNERFTVFRIGE
ncbi:MAG: glycosyltransferase family 39 protein [Gemmatimonadota bacterium]|nr:glycosyltransferase family 39 protein [Gemmatimonadota bacterium]